jgi:hypothetical protein
MQTMELLSQGALQVVCCFPPVVGLVGCICDVTVFVTGGARGIPGPVRSDPSDRDVLELYKEKNAKLQVRFGLYVE